MFKMLKTFLNMIELGTHIKATARRIQKDYD